MKGFAPAGSNAIALVQAIGPARRGAPARGARAITRRVKSRREGWLGLVVLALLEGVVDLLLDVFPVLLHELLFLGGHDAEGHADDALREAPISHNLR